LSNRTNPYQLASMIDDFSTILDRLVVRLQQFSGQGIPPNQYLSPLMPLPLPPALRSPRPPPPHVDRSLLFYIVSQLLCKTQYCAEVTLSAVAIIVWQAAAQLNQRMVS